MTDDDARSPFHAGERALQARVGAREVSERVGRRMIRDFMPEEHREFFAQLPFVLLGSVDAEGSPHVALLFGLPGFVRAADERRLVIDLVSGDAPLRARLHEGAPVGLLGIQLDTRRRNRMNGSVVSRAGDELVVEVDQSYGNCKKYINGRAPTPLAAAEREAGVNREEGPELGQEARALVARTDTFFIASAGPPAPGRAARFSVDVSHRGGPPGFVRERRGARAGAFVFPDYSGNRLFNTLGNLEIVPKAALLFVDFETRATLTLSGRAEVLAPSAEIGDFPGAERLVGFDVESGVFRTNAVPFRWSSAERAREFASF